MTTHPYVRLCFTGSGSQERFEKNFFKGNFPKALFTVDNAGIRITWPRGMNQDDPEKIVMGLMNEANYLTGFAKPS